MSEFVEIRQDNEEFVEVIQFTDSHIFENPEDKFDGVNTLASLKQVITAVRNQNWPPDIILMTGDLVHDPSSKAYEQLLAELKQLEVPVFCIPGNHDVPEYMHRVLTTDNIKVNKTILFQDWCIVMLNSFQSDTHSGHLAQDELELLEQQLIQNAKKHALICLHHPPVKIGSKWMDAMGLDNPGDFFEIVDQYIQVKAILWGHIHQEFVSTHKNIILMASPSTCVQFKPNTEQYVKDDKSPAYRRLKLMRSGEINTELKYI